MQVAVIIPCHNEEQTIGEVVTGFRQALPTAEIWVCDNNSSDATSTEARKHGARVLYEPRPGKGNAVRRMFLEVEADAYVLVDGDATYDPRKAPEMLDALIHQRLDMVTGVRVGHGDGQYRLGHKIGNRLFTGLFAVLFGDRIRDVFSGYRVLSRRFVKTFPMRSKGFEIETEMSAHAAIYRLPVKEIDAPYFKRPEGSNSKLNKFTDGFRILMYFFLFLKDLAPVHVFGVLSAGSFLASLIVSIPVFRYYFTIGEIPNMPSVVLAAALGVLGCVFLTCALILHMLRHAVESNFLRDYSSVPRHLPAEDAVVPLKRRQRDDG